MNKTRKLYLIFEICSIIFVIISIALNQRFMFDLFLALTVFHFLGFFLTILPSWIIGLISFIILFILTLLICYAYLAYDMFPQQYFFSISSFYVYIIAILSTCLFDYILISDKKLKDLLFPIILTIMLFAFLYPAFDDKIHTAYYTIATDKLDNPNREIKIIQLSDTHSTIYPDDTLVEKIKMEKPDFILLTGDIIDDILPVINSEYLLEKIKDIAPIYYCTGNHEYMSQDFEKRIKRLESFGITYLNDEFVLLDVDGNKISFSGVNDPYLNYIYEDYLPIDKRIQNLEKKYSKIDYKGFRILLSHRPEISDVYSKCDYDLVLSGHAHGGQVRIPLLLNGFAAPDQGFFPKYAGGLYKLNSTTKMVVSRGLSINSLPRVFNPPELVVITIKSSQK